jgi:tetratricopeptide (TPR) repeat protein
LLNAVHSVAEEDLQRALRVLANAELLYVRGIAPDATYQFKHALIRDAAYEALLKSRRKELHRLVARTIDEKFPTIKETHPELLARHWTEAGETESAIAEWTRAGNAAEARNAFSEALENYRQAVDLIPLSPESPERSLGELDLRESIFRMSYVLKGHATRESQDALERFARLAERSGNLRRVAGSMQARGFGAYFSGDLATAAALADNALELAVRDGNPTLLANVYFLQVATRGLLGDLAAAEKHFAAGVKFFDDPGFRSRPLSAVAAISGGAFTAWMLGRTELARKRHTQMMSAAKENNAADAASAWMYAAILQTQMREFKQAEASAEKAIALSEQHQFSYQAASCRCVSGEAKARLGRAGEGITLLRAGIAGLLQIGMPLRIAYNTALLAEAEHRQGAFSEALETIERAFQAKSDAPQFRPEIFRIQGEVRFDSAQEELAEGDFREAIAIARSMGAKAFELRATMSLARLLARHGCRDEARSTLADIYNWFSEGFDTADLKDAKALLDELSR